MVWSGKDIQQKMWKVYREFLTAIYTKSLMPFEPDKFRVDSPWLIEVRRFRRDKDDEFYNDDDVDMIYYLNIDEYDSIDLDACPTEKIIKGFVLNRERKV